MTKIKYKDLPKYELPRERLAFYGAENLKNDELISILIGSGTKKHQVSELSHLILKDCKNISNLKEYNINTLQKIEGLGLAKAAIIIAALELGKRVYEKRNLIPNIQLTNAKKVHNNFSKYISNEMQENFMVIYLDAQKRYITHKIIFKGTINKSIIHPREIFREAFLEGASFIIIMHNHPSGCVKASPEDNETTRVIAETGILMGVPLLDHIIVGGENYFSYEENQKLVYE